MTDENRAEAAVLHGNVYSGEHFARRTIAEAGNKHGFVVERYALVDDGTKRKLTVRLAGRPDVDGTEPPVLAALRNALRENGYEPGPGIRLTIDGTKDVSNQMQLRLGGDGHPDNYPV